MKIVGRVLITLAGALALVSAAVVGCSTTNNLNNGQGTSGPGETCTRSFDCKSGLVCEQGVCFASSTSVSPDGSIIVVDGGDGGSTMTGPHLGELHESCQTSRDCESPLECIGQECSVVNYGLTATGKTCVECNTAADCCELPVSFYAGDLYYDVLLDSGTYASGQLYNTSLRCQDLATFIGDTTTCANAANFAPGLQDVATACFYYNTYCGTCGANGPWACNNNACVYNAPCTVSGTIVQERAAQCPSETRLGHALSTLCNSADGGTTGACSAGCAMDSDCAGKTPIGTNHTCSAADAGGGGSCICGSDKACYFSCTSDLDCAAGKTCDTTAHLCKTGGCTADADCIQQLGNPNGKCMMNTCSISCTKDTDCSPPSTICSAGFCKAAGCTSDVDCNGGGAHSFCVTTPPTTTQYSSAITN